MPTPDFYIVPADALDATADAIREKTGSQASIEFTQDGFANAIGDIESGLTVEEALTPGLPAITGEVVFTGQYLSPFAFANNTGLTKFTGNNVIRPFNRAATGNSIGVAGTFLNCTGLTEVHLQSLETLDFCDKTFYGCTSLAVFDIPFKTLTSTGAGAFYGCTYLPSLVLPSLNANFNADTFGGCVNMEYIDVGKAFSTDRTLNANAFKGCSSLKEIVIRGGNNGSRKMTLGNISAFTGTPFASDGAGGVLYVPASLVSTYQSATNWSTILGYANNQIKSIESTHTDPNAPIDLTLYYADGTLIPT